MTDQEAVETLESYFNERWVETDIFFSQVPRNPVSGTEFVSFAVLPVLTSQVGIGTYPEFRAFCIVQIDVNIPSGTGTRRAIELGDQVSELFLGKQIDGVTVRDKSVSELVIEDFYRRIIRFNCHYDQTTS